MLVQRLINSNKYNIKCPYAMTPKGIAIHNTANDASASNEISYMQSNNNEVSYHIAIDDKEAIQGLPLDRNSWNAGDGGSGNGNRNYIAVEICYSKSGGDRFSKAEARAVKEVAELCRKYNFTVDNIKAHREFSGKNCPHRTDIDNFRYLVQIELNKNITEEVLKVDNIVVFGNDIDKRAAEYLADHLQCAIISKNTNYNYANIKNVYCIGGSKNQFTSYCTKFIAGSDRYETVKNVLSFMGKL